jgi:CHAT domain-containing protein
MLKTAAATLKAGIAALGSAPAARSGYHRLLALLADVYYCSAHYDRAVETAQKCRTWMDQHAAELPRAEFQEQRQEVTLLWVRSLVARGSVADPGNQKPLGDRKQAEELLAESLQGNLNRAGPFARLEVLVLAAEVAQDDKKTTDVKQQQSSRDRWREAEKHGRAILERLAPTASPELLARGVRLHARCLAALARHDDAVAELKWAIGRLNDPEHPAGYELGSELWGEIARLEARPGHCGEEIEACGQILRRHASESKKRSPGRLADAKLAGSEAEDHYRLALALHRAHRDAEAGQHIKQCKAAYQRALASLSAADPGDTGEAKARKAAILSGLLAVDRQQLALEGHPPGELTDQMLAVVVQLHQLLSELLLEDDPRIHALAVSLGARYVGKAEFDRARRYLTAAEQFYSRCQPPDPLCLARVKNLLSEIERERAEGSVAGAAKLLEEADHLYQREGLQDQPLRLAIWLNQGRLAAATGKYALAARKLDDVVNYDPGAEGPTTELRCLALLNKGLLYKALSRFELAEQLCQKALDKRRRQCQGDAAELLPYYVALAGIQIDAGKRGAAKEMVQKALAICKSNGLTDTHLEAQLRHQLALIHFCNYLASGNEADAAAAFNLWEELRTLQSGPDWRLQQAQTLHYLSRLKYLKWRHDAEQAWRHYTKLDTDYKPLAERFDKDLEAFKTSRQQYDDELRLYNRRGKRSEKYRELSDWHDKLKIAERELIARRTELDGKRAELRAANERESNRLHDPLLKKADELAAQAIDRLDRYPNLQHAALCNRAEILRAEGHRDKAMALLAEAVALLEKPRVMLSGTGVTSAEFFAAYAAAYDLQVAWAIQDGDPFKALVFAELRRNRTLLDDLQTSGIATGQNAASAEEARRLMSQQVLGKSLTEKDVEEVVRRQLGGSEAVVYYHLGTTGAFAFLLVPGQKTVESYPLQPQHPGSLAAEEGVSRSFKNWVVAYWEALKDKDFQSAMAADGATLRTITDSLVPNDLRRRIRQTRPANCVHLMIVPDGSLYRLPFEALVVESGKRPRFLVDELRPMAFSYAPSLMVLDTLKRKPRVAESQAATVLSAAPVDFAGITPANAAARRTFGDRRLADLPHSETESLGVAGAFQTSPLLRGAATEGELRQRLATQHPAYLHLATHCVAPQGALAGESALVFAVSRQRPARREDDGLLELAEIAGLPLAHCELVALSACGTNLGRQDFETEMAVAMSRAFLAAGARRVVASQWPVTDRGTAELMVRFFRTIADCRKEGKPCDYSVALQQARDELRNSAEKWAAPYYWAPFVLLGPAD